MMECTEKNKIGSSDSESSLEDSEFHLQNIVISDNYILSCLPFWHILFELKPAYSNYIYSFIYKRV